jgi:hypothetical protein
MAARGAREWSQHNDGVLKTARDLREMSLNVRRDATALHHNTK